MKIFTPQSAGLLRDAAAGKSSMKLGAAKTGTVLPWKAFANLKVILAVSTFVLFVGSTWVIASEPERIRVRDVLRSSDRTLSDSQRWENYRKVSQEKLRDPADVKAVHEEMKKLRSEVKDEEQGLRLMRMTELLAAPLAAATDPSAHSAVRDLLDTESRSLPRNYSGPWTAKTREEEIHEGMRWARVEALMKAAGDGKNEDSLPALRRIFRQGGLAGDEAARAIGKIGRQEDLAAFIRVLKDDPNARVDLSPFGARALEAIALEISSAPSGNSAIDNLIGSIPPIKHRSDFHSYRALMSHDNKFFRSVVGRHVAQSVGPNDVAQIQELLADNDPEIAIVTLGALGRMMNEPEIVTLVLGILVNHNDNLFRRRAAFILGDATTNLDEVANALRSAEQEDQDRHVRDVASHSLTLLNRK